jgi:membrane protein
VKLNALSLAFTLGMLVLLLAALACLVALPVIEGYMPSLMVLVLTIARWPVLLALAALTLSLIYRYGPCRAEPKWRWVSWGASFAAFLWLVASGLFSWYAANFGSYNKTYGSLGAIIGFMTWMWLSVIVVLVGAKLNAEVEHQTAQDSTEGRSKPLGARGAKMADTVGAST